MFQDIVENLDWYSNKDDFWKKNPTFWFERFYILINIFVECIFWLIFKEIAKKNKDLYRKKDLWKKFKTIFFYLFILKILYFVSISVKCISCEI